MAKELPYFRFTASEWLNGDISLEASYLKGIFIDICAYYWFKDCSITKALLKKRFKTDIDGVNDLIELCIIDWDDETDYIQINFLNEQYDILSEKRKARQIAGSKGGKKRSSNAKAKLKQSSSYKDKYKDKDKDKYNNVASFDLALNEYKHCRKLTTAKKHWDFLEPSEQQTVMIHAKEVRQIFEEENRIKFLPDFSNYLYERMFEIPIDNFREPDSEAEEFKKWESEIKEMKNGTTT